MRAVALCILVLCASLNQINGQSRNYEATTISSKAAYAEKIYLQLSATTYTTDDMVWFKAIVTDANHIPTILSGVLHVELIDFDERIIDQKLLKLENGITNGFFQLNQTMPAGRYLVRAYTEWNKNFNEDFIAKQYVNVYAPEEILKEEEAIRNIVITETASKQLELSAKLYPKLINPKYRGKLKLFIETDNQIDSIVIKKDEQREYIFNYLLPEDVVKVRMELKLDSIKLRNNNLGFLSTYSKKIIVNKAYTDLQFFPEGGKLINGLVSKVGFKALDYKHEGKKVFGNIVDQYDSIITPFTSNHLGMGSLFLRADKRRIYYGKIKGDDDLVYKYLLPKVYETGFVLTARPSKDHIRIAINSNQSEQDSLSLRIKSRGVVYHDLDLKLTNGMVHVAVEKLSLPEGIIKFTVLDRNGLPICERLVFNYAEKNRVQISAKTHLNSYSQRDKTIIDIKATDVQGKTINSNLSVLVLNEEQLGAQYEKQQNILSYFLLNSELAGPIEKPSHYFDPENKFRYQDMDMLMLTQGWRNYIYNDTKNDRHFKVKPEKTLSVAGSVKGLWNPKKLPKKPVDLTMMVFGDPMMVLSQRVDSLGRFDFQIGDVYSDDLEFVLQSSNDKGKKKNYTISFDKKITPEINFEKQEYFQFADTINRYLEKSIERKQAEQAFELASGTITLDEVELTGYKMTPEREKMMELHGPPDVVIEDKELHKKIKKWSYGLFSVLMFSYPEDISVRRVGNAGGFLLANVNSADFSFIIIDGMPVEIHNYSLIGGLPTEEIKSVEIIKRPKNPRKYVSEVFGNPLALPGPVTISFINIYTYSNKGLFGVQRTSGITKSVIPGFSPTMEFYAPEYENISAEDWKAPDLRSVVYWNPSVTTDIEGKAQVEFYNADNTGDMLVIIEGITKEGKIGHYRMMYTVSEKLEK